MMSRTHVLTFCLILAVAAGVFAFTQSSGGRPPEPTAEELAIVEDSVERIRKELSALREDSAIVERYGRFQSLSIQDVGKVAAASAPLPGIGRTIARLEVACAAQFKNYPGKVRVMIVGADGHTEPAVELRLVPDPVADAEMVRERTPVLIDGELCLMGETQVNGWTPSWISAVVYVPGYEP